MRRTLTLTAVAAAVLVVGGVAAVTSNDFLRATAGDVIRPLPSRAASLGPLDPAAQRYLDAVAAEDTDALTAAFAPDALVVDVGRQIRGRNAIRRWAANEVIGGVYTLLEHTPRAGGVTMLVRFRPGGVGGFRANYHFDISHGLITKATLEYA
ncbi:MULTISPECIES: nuclear transport factor 2 family protein [unclassified Nonomuraea]|uniref:nuclear transport factor 2 family protein n=1 Tax=unclassified Nonomuraea TaxID=2593643 RepID=UPI003401011F